MLEILGCAATAPTPAGPASSYLVESATGVILVDAGPGSLAAYAARHDLDRLRGIVVTHLHADHSLDLMAWAYRWTFPVVREPVPLLVPAGERERLEAFDALFGIPSLPTMNRPILQSWDLHEMPRDGASDHVIDGVTIRSFAALHAVPSAALRLTLPDGRVLAFSSDTGPCDGVVDAARDADVFVCEATYLEATPAELTGHGHLTGRLAGELAQRAGAAHLVLTHLSDPADGPAARADASESCTGRISLASPGLVIA
ncbi:MAG: MBL fold metallo-hydrolase [Microbacterium sp.]